MALHNAVRYLKGCPDLVLGGIDDPYFFAYADASHTDWPDRKSTEGCIWLFAGGPVAWSSKKQTIMYPPSTAAEWCALDRLSRDARWVRKIAEQLELSVDPITILTDNINTQLLMSKKACSSANRLMEIHIAIPTRVATPNELLESSEFYPSRVCGIDNLVPVRVSRGTFGTRGP